jgi:hypothetical protein
MTATMIKVERNAKMEAAIERCKKAHPRIRRASADTTTVITSSSSHTVRILQPREGLVLAQCSCQAGLRSILCLHIPAALAAPWTPATQPAHKLAGILSKCGGNVLNLEGWHV